LPIVTQRGVPKDRRYQPLPTYPGSPPALGAPGSAPVWGSHLSPRNGYSWLTFERFKRLVGTIPGYHWHHVVEQNPANTARFGVARLNTNGNLIPIERPVHIKISAYYSSKRPFTGGKKVREWLKTQSFEEQHAFGVRVLRDFGVIP